MSITLVFPVGFKPVLKHAEHDQTDHGNRDGGGLETQAKQFKTFEEFSNAISLQGLRPRMWHIAEDGFKLDPNRKPTNRLGGTSDEAGLFVGDPETWQDYAIDRKTVIEYDMTGLTWTKNPLSDTKADFFSDQSGNQGFFVRPQGFGKLKEIGRFSIEEAKNRAIKQQNEMPKSKEEARKIWESLNKVLKHGDHDQSDHGSWATGASGGNNLSVEEVMRLHKGSDPLQKKVYEAEQSLDKPSQKGEAPILAPREKGQSSEEYDKLYKEYSKKFTEYAVEAQANIFTETGKELLDGSPAGVKEYVETIIKSDWFLKNFGDGSSLPPLVVKVGTTNAAGRHILQIQRDSATREILKTKHELSFDRQFTKSERTILHEISHYATSLSQTKPFESHGVEFARTHLFVVGQAAGLARAKELATAYKEKGVDVGN